MNPIPVLIIPLEPYGGPVGSACICVPHNLPIGFLVS